MEFCFLEQKSGSEGIKVMRRLNQIAALVISYNDKRFVKPQSNPENEMAR